MKKVIAKGSFLRSDTREQVSNGQSISGDPEYLAELVRVGNATEASPLDAPASGKKEAPSQASKKSAPERKGKK